MPVLRVREETMSELLDFKASMIKETKKDVSWDDVIQDLLKRAKR